MISNATATYDRTTAFLARRYPLIAHLLTHRQREIIFAAAGLFVAIYVSQFLTFIVTANDLMSAQGSVIGGDFFAFWTAAQNTFVASPTLLYDADHFQEQMLKRLPERETILLYWQYPPTMMLLTAPAAALPYLPAYFAWLVSNTALLGAVLHRLWRNKTALILALTSLAAFQGWITGQTGLFTAALITTAAACADRRPVIAGIAAGILTFKPQLGLLIPIAFLAAGCWRAFAVAALTSFVFALASVAAFGVDTWLAFFEAIRAHSDRMQSTVFPYHKIISLYGGLKMLGAPNLLALCGQGLSTIALAGFVFHVWRRSSEWDLRTIALCAAIPLATPYALYYELPILIAPLFLVARRATLSTWLTGEKFALMALWLAPIALPGTDTIPGIPLSFLVAASAFFICARRVQSDLGSEGSPGLHRGA